MQKIQLILLGLVSATIADPYFFSCKQRHVFRGDGIEKYICPTGT